MNGWSSGAGGRHVISCCMPCCIVLYKDAKPENGMLRAGAMIALLGVALMCGGCSKCASPFGAPGACHSGAPAAD